MFTLAEFDLNVDHTMPPPEPEGWERQWFGYYQMTKTATDSERRNPEFRRLFQRDSYHEGELEILAFLTVLREFAGEHVRFFELGSGRAPWCMALAGAVGFRFLPTPPSSYQILAVEAEPTHFEWSREHLSRQGIAADVVHGAVTGQMGTVRFKADDPPTAHMGQCVRPDGNIEVPSYTIDHLRRTYGFGRINLIHMDLQGQEAEAFKGARECLDNGLIDYIIAGTHGSAVEQALKDSLAPTHHLLVELPQHETRQLGGVAKPFHATTDGVHVYGRKDMPERATGAQ